MEAVFLVNFCRFTTWPADSFVSDTQPLVVAIWSDEQFVSLVENAAKGEHIGKHPILIKRVQAAGDAQSAQLLFVSEANELTFERTFDPTDIHTLLVGESNRFLSSGGHLQFVTGSKIKVRVNLNALKNCGLALNSNLLRICQTQ
ncbi:MAG TPA: YfiR family protein [Opitutaceae bacterium]